MVPRLVFSFYRHHQPNLHLASYTLCDTERLIGDGPKNQGTMNPHNTVFDAKRLIGRKVDDPEIQRDQKHWPFKVAKKNDKPVIEVQYKGDKKQFVRILCYDSESLFTDIGFFVDP